MKRPDKPRIVEGEHPFMTREPLSLRQAVEQGLVFVEPRMSWWRRLQRWARGADGADGADFG